MKVRSGFVSNSSSSSFAVVMTKTDYADALDELPGDIRDFITYHCQPEKAQLGGVEMVLITGIHGDEHYLNGTNFVPRPKDEGPFNRYIAVNKVLDVLKKRPHIFTEVDV